MIFWIGVGFLFFAAAFSYASCCLGGKADDDAGIKDE